MHAAVVSLNEIGVAPDETDGDVLCGCTKCSTEDFKTVFHHLQTQERINHFLSNFLIAATYYDFPSSETTVFKIKHFLRDANDLHNNLTTSNE